MPACHVIAKSLLILATALLFLSAGMVWRLETPTRNPAHPAGSAPRPQGWAALVDERFKLYRIQTRLYRSALPDGEALPLLKSLGILTVINFYQHSDANWLRDPHIRQIHLPLHTDRIDDSDVIEVLRSIRQAQALGPVLIHCKHGQNRTGLIAALYRVVHEGWSKQQALEEMRGGFGGEQRLGDAERYLRQVDIEALRKALDSGACSTNPWALCEIRTWLERRL